MSSGSLSDMAAALVRTFSQPNITRSQLADLQLQLTPYVERHNRGDEHAAGRLQEELRVLHRDYVMNHPNKLGSFISVLKDLRPSMFPVKDAVEWFEIAVKPFIEQLNPRRDSIEDAQEFVVGTMVYDEEAPEAREKAKVSAQLTHKLLEEYISRSRLPECSKDKVSVQSQDHAQQQIQAMLLAFGRKQPKDLFNAIDVFLVNPDTRFRTLHLLSAWLQLQQAHLYLVDQTPIVEHLLKCLMNDRSTAVVSAALQCLVMLLPHIPVTIPTQLPRLFLIYSRCLCWEKFSASSSKAQKDHVTDNRVRRSSDATDEELFSIDPSWEVVHSVPTTSDSSAPQLLSYFTYLYGLYPLNFMSYIRKPRKYLKNANFQGADDFDLDQAVIRSRTEQYQRAHLLHPNFFSITAEEELADNRWLKAEPSEVVAECFGLYAGVQAVPGLPGPPPSTKLPALPQLPILDMFSQNAHAKSGGAPSGQSSPGVGPTDTSGVTGGSGGAAEASHTSDDPSRPSTAISMHTSGNEDVLFLHRELMLIRNELNFERYLKQQHVAAIGQLKRDRIKAVTMEAETATLINSNKALQKKLSDANRFNEKMQKETQARRTHTRQSEDQLTAKIRSLRSGLTDQQALQASLQKACDDCDQLRQLLVESEARELRMKQQVEDYGQKSKELEALKKEVEDFKRQLRAYQDREHEFGQAAAEHEMLQRDLEVTRMMVSNRDQERERSKKAFQDKIADLESRLAAAEGGGLGSTVVPQDVADLEVRLADAQAKQLSMKRSYNKVLQELTDIRLKYEDLLATQGIEPDGPAPSVRAPPLPSGRVYDFGARDVAWQGQLQQDLWHGPPVSQHYRQPDMFAHPHSYMESGQYLPTGQSFPPNRPVRSEAYEQRQQNSSPLSRSEGASFHDSPMLHPNWDGIKQVAALDSGNGLTMGYGPLMGSSRSAFSLDSDDQESMRSQDKVQAKSEMRIYGRGGAQNIKMRNKDKLDKTDKSAKSTGLTGLKGIL